MNFEWMFLAIVCIAYYMLFRKHLELGKPVFSFRRNTFRSYLYLWIVCVFFIGNALLTLETLRRQPASLRTTAETMAICGGLLLIMIGATLWAYFKYGEGVFKGGIAFGGMAHTWSSITNYKLIPAKKPGKTVVEFELKDPKRGNISQRRITLPDKYIPELEEGLKEFI